MLLNADREATRFAARGQYLDFRQTERDAIGYDSVLSHTLASLARQLDFDVQSGDPNGTLIVSHYLVDTRKPCQDPPCNEDCAADKHNKDDGCDCTTPDRREDDYPYDDLILHPGTPGYEHYTALYGIPRESRLNHAEIVAQLKEQNDAINCSLNLKDPSVPWVPNSAVVVEAFYNQPQLLGVPIVSNYFTDPVPLYVNTMMRVTIDRSGGNMAEIGCELLPIGVEWGTVDSLESGAYLSNIREGTGSGNFGWLRWTDDTEVITSDPNSEGYLYEELENPRLSMTDYKEPEHKDPTKNDTTLNAGDWVWGLTGNINSEGVVRDALDKIIKGGQWYLIPVWDKAEGTGSNVVYHIVGFARVKLDLVDLTGNPKTISAWFDGFAENCPAPPP